VIGDKPIFSFMLLRRTVEIQIQDQSSNPPVDIDAVVFDTQSLVEKAGWLLLHMVGIEKFRIWRGVTESRANRPDKIGLRTPKILRSQLHNLRDAVERAAKFQLTIKFKHRRAKSHDHPLLCIRRGTLAQKTAGVDKHAAAEGTLFLQ
jgi:hypothetical protein